MMVTPLKGDSGGGPKRAASATEEAQAAVEATSGTELASVAVEVTGGAGLITAAL